MADASGESIERKSLKRSKRSKFEAMMRKTLEGLVADLQANLPTRSIGIQLSEALNRCSSDSDIIRHLKDKSSVLYNSIPASILAKNSNGTRYLEVLTLVTDFDLNKPSNAIEVLSEQDKQGEQDKQDKQGGEGIQQMNTGIPDLEAIVPTQLVNLAEEIKGELGDTIEMNGMEDIGSLIDQVKDVIDRKVQSGQLDLAELTEISSNLMTQMGPELMSMLGGLGGQGGGLGGLDMMQAMGTIDTMNISARPRNT